jgi:uncharacterized protein YbaR (Trm112 family)
VPIPKDVLEILVCPVTMQPLQLLSDEQLSKLNAKIAHGGVQNAGGAKVETALDEGLITTDAKTIYRASPPINSTSDRAPLSASFTRPSLGYGFSRPGPSNGHRK